MSSLLQHALGWAALHALWQGTLIGAALWLHNRQATSPYARYRAAGGALALCFVAFAVTAFLYVQPAIDATSVSETNPLRPIMQRALFTTPDVLRWAGVAWLLGAAFVAIRFIVGWFFARHAYVRRAVPADVSWQQRVERIARAQRIAPPRVLQSPVIDSPAVFGARSPVLVLPTSGIDQLDDAQIDGIILHELTHIQRHDGAANLLQTLVDVVLFFHPAVRYMSRLVRLEREHICDACAVDACGNPRSYIGALLALEETRCYAASVVMSARSRGLVERVRTLVRPPTPSRLPSAVLQGAAGVTLAVAAACTVAVPPMLKAVGEQVAAALHYTVSASDPAGNFTLSIERGKAVNATIAGAAVARDRIVQNGDSVYILGRRGELALAVRVRPTGGISWAPRSQLSSL